MGSKKKSSKGMTPATSDASKKSSDNKTNGSKAEEKINKNESKAPLELGNEAEDETPSLTINREYAKEYQNRKQKEELSQLERKRKLLGDDADSEESSESETEDEDGELLTKELDDDINKTLRLIRKKDPAIYNKSVAFYQQEDDSDDETEKKETKDQPLYYRDLVRRKAMEGDFESDEGSEDEEPVKTYQEEQEDLKQAFLSSANADDEANDPKELDGGLFTVRKKTVAEEKEEAEEMDAFRTKYGTKVENKKEVDPDAFLQQYISNEGWKEKRELPYYDDIVDEEDAEAVEEAEAFEHQYNFRFEEPEGGNIQTHARQIDDSMRREDDRRKRRRAERKERKALERQKKEEELRRLKNLKQAEVEKKLERVEKLMGKREENKLRSEDLEGAFDPEEHDKRMQEIFDEEYYDEEEGEIEKPTWTEEEDKELFGDIPDEDEEEEEEQEEEQEEEKEEEKEEEEEQEQEEQEEEEEDEGEEEEEWKNMSVEEMKKAKQKYLDELYSLDYEDLIGDIRCRFKYKDVQANDFGLSVDDIMQADEKDLKQLVSLKRLAPYRDSEYEVSKKRVKQLKRSLQERQKAQEEEKESRKAQKTTEDDADKKKRKRSRGKGKSEEKSGETNDESAPAKKKKRRSKKKKDSNPYEKTGLSSSRLESYKLTK